MKSVSVVEPLKFLYYIRYFTSNVNTQTAFGGCETQ